MNFQPRGDCCGDRIAAKIIQDIQVIVMADEAQGVIATPMTLGNVMP